MPNGLVILFVVVVIVVFSAYPELVVMGVLLLSYRLAADVVVVAIFHVVVGLLPVRRSYTGDQCRPLICNTHTCDTNVFTNIQLLEPWLVILIEDGFNSTRSGFNYTVSAMIVYPFHHRDDYGMNLERSCSVSVLILWYNRSPDSLVAPLIVDSGPVLFLELVEMAYFYDYFE